MPGATRAAEPVVDPRAAAPQLEIGLVGLYGEGAARARAAWHRTGGCAVASRIWRCAGLRAVRARQLRRHATRDRSTVRAGSRPTSRPSTATATRSAACSMNRLDLDSGPVMPYDETFGAWDPTAHVIDDLFENKLAFVVLLNFPLTTLAERERDGAKWTRRQWAETRLAERFRGASAGQRAARRSPRRTRKPGSTSPATTSGCTTWWTSRAGACSRPGMRLLIALEPARRDQGGLRRQRSGPGAPADHPACDGAHRRADDSRRR